MALAAKRDDNPDRCGCCGTGEFRCPRCPLGPKPYRDRGMDRLMRDDPEMGRVMLWNAKAARALVLCHESHPAFAELERDYIEAGARLAEIRAERRKACAS